MKNLKHIGGCIEPDPRLHATIPFPAIVMPFYLLIFDFSHFPIVLLISLVLPHILAKSYSPRVLQSNPRELTAGYGESNSHSSSLCYGRYYSQDSIGELHVPQ